MRMRCRALRNTAVPLAWLLQRFVAADVKYSRWLLGVWLVLITHPLLDGFTVYGTQIWWPLAARPVAWGSMFIIDPVYTIPLILGLVMAWRRRDRLGRGINTLTLTLSTVYLAWSLVAQQIARDVAEHALAEQGVSVTRLLVAPFPLTLLWRYVALTDDTYHEGYYSLLDESHTVSFMANDTGRELLGPMATHWPVARLDWFTHSMIAVERRDDELVISDLRMGIEANYVFEFVVGNWQDEQWRMVPTRLLPPDIDIDRVVQVWRRIWDSKIVIERS